MIGNYLRATRSTVAFFVGTVLSQVFDEKTAIFFERNSTLLGKTRINKHFLKDISRKFPTAQLSTRYPDINQLKCATNYLQDTLLCILRHRLCYYCNFDKKFMYVMHL